MPPEPVSSLHPRASPYCLFLLHPAPGSLRGGSLFLLRLHRRCGRMHGGRGAVLLSRREACSNGRLPAQATYSTSGPRRRSTGATLCGSKMARVMDRHASDRRGARHCVTSLAPADAIHKPTTHKPRQMCTRFRGSQGLRPLGHCIALMGKSLPTAVCKVHKVGK